MRRIAIALALVTVLSATAGAAAADDAPGIVTLSPEQLRSAGLKTAVAEPRPITEAVHAPAIVAFDPSLLAAVRPLAPARVVALLVQPGDRIAAGHVIARLMIPSLVEIQSRQASARAALREAEANLLVARNAAARARALVAAGYFARAEAERRNAAQVQAASQLEAARDQMRALDAEVAQMHPGALPGTAELVAPISGTVVSVGVSPGAFIDSTTAAVSVADLSTVVALADIPEASAVRVAPGDDAVLTLDAGGGRTWHARVLTIGAELDPTARTLPVRFELANPDQSLRAGMFMDAVITSRRGRTGITVPVQAVQFIGDRRVAFVPLGGGKFQRHELSIGVSQPDWIEVRSGLAAGDSVVTNGSFELKSLLQQQMLGGSG